MSANCLPEWAISHSQRLIGAVRDYDSTAVNALLMLPEPDLKLLALTLAAMVPDDRSPAELLIWNDKIDDLIARRRGELAGLKPCGTRAAWMRHKANGEQPDPACEEANRAYQREAKRRQYAVTRRARQDGDAA